MAKDEKVEQAGARKITPQDEATLFKLRKQLSDLAMKEYSAKAAHACAKKEVENAQAKLNSFIDELHEPNLFKSEPVAEWRTVSLDDLGITGKAAEKLAENDPPLTTLGAIADWTRDGRLLTEVKGIGESTADKIEEQMDQWWKDHPEANRTPVESDEAEAA